MEQKMWMHIKSWNKEKTVKTKKIEDDKSYKKGEWDTLEHIVFFDIY